MKKIFTSIKACFLAFCVVSASYAFAQQDTMKVTITDLPTMKIAYVRHIGPYQDCHEAWNKLIAWASKQGLLNKKNISLGIGYDNPETTPANELRYDAAIVIDDDHLMPEDDVDIKELESRPYAMAEHVGPYENLGQTYSYIYGYWASKNHVEIDYLLPCIEIYKNCCHNTPQEQLLTEVYVPIKN